MKSLSTTAPSQPPIESLFAAGSDGKATVVVTTWADVADSSDGVTSLREAINFSNATTDIPGWSLHGGGPEGALQGESIAELVEAGNLFSKFVEA